MILIPPKLLFYLLLLAILAQAYNRGLNDDEPKGDDGDRFLKIGAPAWETTVPVVAVGDMAPQPDILFRKKEKSEAPTSSPSSQLILGYQVDLSDFVVSMSNSTHSHGVTNYLMALLEYEFKKDFDSLLQVVVQLNSISSNSGQDFSDELFYSGQATFAGVVSDDDVRDEQASVLLDPGNFNISSPNVVAIRMAFPTNTTTSSGQGNAEVPVPSPAQQQQNPAPASSLSMTGLTLGAILVAAMVIGLAVFLGYNYYKSQSIQGGNSNSDEGKNVESRTTDPESFFPGELARPDEYSGSIVSYGMNTENDDISFSGVSILNSDAGFDNVHHELKPTTADESSMGESSIADSEVGLDATQLYLARRLKEKERQYQLALLAHKGPPCLYEFDAELPHDFQFQKFMESDDEDLYLTDNDKSIACSENPSECKESEKGLSLLRWKQHKARMAASRAAS